MIKVSIFLTRRPDLTREEFVTYWTNKHTPLLATLPPGALQVHRYVQLQPTDDEIPGIGTAVCDGVAELWVDSVADAAAWFTSETYNSASARAKGSWPSPARRSPSTPSPTATAAGSGGLGSFCGSSVPTWGCSSAPAPTGSAPSIFGTTLKGNEVSNAIYRDFLPSALAEGRYLTAPKPTVIGAGVGEFQRAMDIQLKGVSATKIVVTLP